MRLTGEGRVRVGVFREDVMMFLFFIYRFRKRKWDKGGEKLY